MSVLTLASSGYTPQVCDSKYASVVRFWSNPFLSQHMRGFGKYTVAQKLAGQDGSGSVLDPISAMTTYEGFFGPRKWGFFGTRNTAEDEYGMRLSPSHVSLHATSATCVSGLLMCLLRGEQAT